MKNKIKTARQVKFLEDYTPKSIEATAEKMGTTVEPTFKKGDIVAMHQKVAESLKAKGAKMEIAKIDAEAVVARQQKLLKERQKKAVGA